VPCYRCGVRQTDPERGKSPWRRGVLRDELVLVCPRCQDSGEWTAELESCARCASLHLIRRLGQVECLDCGLVREPEALLIPGLPGMSTAPGRGAAGSPDAALAEEVGRALDRLLRRTSLSPVSPGSAKDRRDASTTVKEARHHGREGA
jgi:hypothetical protein